MKKHLLAITMMACALLMGNGLFAQQAKPKPKQQVDPTKWTVVRLSLNEKHGYINNRGKVVIQPTFDDVKQFTKDGLARARKGRWGVIDKNGKWVIQPEFDNLSDMSEGLRAAKSNGLCGYIDKAGKWVISPQFSYKDEWLYDVAKDFHEGLAAVCVDGKYGFIDKTGKMVIEPQFTNVNVGFEKGVCVVKVGGNWGCSDYDGKRGIIDKTGKWIVEPNYSMWEFNEDVACVATPEGKVGFMDRTGKWVIEPQFDLRNRYEEYGDFDGLSRFEGGLACVLSNGKYGFIDKAGKWVIEPQFECKSFFKDGYAEGKINGKCGVIDKKGNWVVQPTYCGMQNYSAAKNQFVVYNCNGDRITGEGVIDVTGKTIIPLVYGSIEFNGDLYDCTGYEDYHEHYYITPKGEVVYTLRRED